MNARLLIVDDDPATRELIAEVVRDLDPEIHEAASDDEGFSRFLEVGPDVVLIDLLLPRKGGMSLLRRIRGVRGGRDVPVIVMSAVYRGADIRAEAVEELGAVDFLKKPFHLPLLRERLRSVLAERREPRAAVEPFGMEIPVGKGSLTGVELPVLLRDLDRRAESGCLHLRLGRMQKVLYLQDGKVVFASSNRLSETFGRYLLGAGLIDEEVYREGLDAMRAEGVRMGEFLVARGVLDTDAMHGALRQHVWERLLQAFEWVGGDFRLGPYQAPPTRLPGIPFEIHRLVWEGVRHRYPYERIAAALGPYQEMPVGLPGDVFDVASRIPLEREDLQLLHLVRRSQGQPLGNLLRDARGEAEVRTLYYLMVYGYLGLADEGDGAVGAPELDMADLARVRRARRELEAMRGRNYFQVLGVGPDAGDDAVRHAYLQKAKDVHPDVLGSDGPPALHRICEEAFRLVQAAYDALKTEARRREYLAFLEGSGEEAIQDPRSVLEAESLFQRGRLLLRRRQWDRAAEAFEGALSLNPDEGEYVLQLGIVRMRQAAAGRDGGIDEAEELFRRAAELLPGAPEPWYRLGRIWSLRGDPAKAETHFRAALRRDPRHTESLRELRLLELRAEKRKGRGLTGFLRMRNR